MSTANRSDRGVTDSGFLTLVIDALRRSATIADHHQRHRRRGEPPRGAALAPPARPRNTARSAARLLDAPVVVTGAPNRNDSARPSAGAAHFKHRFPSFL